MIKVVELFAGIGAQATALENLGIEHKCIISEIDQHAIRMYEAMHGKVENLGDIHQVEHLPDCDLVTWSFPCQSLSISGKMEGMAEGSGSKSSLGWEAIRLIRDAVERERPPKFLVMENVRSITFKKNRGEFERMISILSSLGYASKWAILNAKDFGVPQSRSRCFMISVHGREAIDLPEGFPLSCRLLDYLDAEVDESLYLSSDRVAVFERHRHRQEVSGRGFGWRPKNPKSAEDRVARAVTLNPDRYVNTWIIETDSEESGAEIILSGNVGEYRIRYLSDRESWRLMGFSEDRIDRAFAVEPSKTARYKAAGNSIVVPVLEAIFERILTKYDPHQTTIEHFIEVTE